MKFVFVLLFGCSNLLVLGQTTDTTAKPLAKDFHFSAYFEFYGAVDEGNKSDNERPPFLFNHTRIGELALNLGLVKASWQKDQLRANMALMAGSYAVRNLAAEPEVFKHVYEANIGLKLSKKKNVWLDMGIMNSHIGLESAIGKDSPTLTRSFIAENSPYYETGAKLTRTSESEKWNLSLLVLNGWQRIYQYNGNYLPAAGMQISYKPNEKILLNYSNYVGDESPSNDFVARIYNDFYFVYSPTKKAAIYGAFDLGLQQQFQGKDWPMNSWYGWFGVFRFAFTEKFAMAMRMEQYDDPQEVIIYSESSIGFQSNGYSVNADFKIHENALLRLEARRLESKYAIFPKTDFIRTNIYNGVTASIAVSF